MATDAKTLTPQPEQILKYICERIGVTWDSKMLSWKSRKVEEFSMEHGFHKDGENSTGFQAKVNGNHDQDGELPEIVHQTIAENMPLYEYRFCIQGMKIGKEDLGYTTMGYKRIK